MVKDFPLFRQAPVILRNSAHELYTSRIVSADIDKLKDVCKRVPGSTIYLPPRGGPAIMRSKAKPCVEMSPEAAETLDLPTINAEYGMVVQWAAKEEWFRRSSGLGMTGEAQKKFDYEIWYKVKVLLFANAWVDFPMRSEVSWLNDYIKNRSKLRENLDRARRSPLNFSSDQSDESFGQLRISRRQQEHEEEAVSAKPIDPNHEEVRVPAGAKSFRDFLQSK